MPAEPKHQAHERRVRLPPRLVLRTRANPTPRGTGETGQRLDPNVARLSLRDPEPAQLAGALGHYQVMRFRLRGLIVGYFFAAAESAASFANRSALNRSVLSAIARRRA